MKKSRLVMVMLALFVGVMGCSKDDDGGDGGDPASVIAGSYKGTLTIIGGEPIYDAIVVVTRKDASTISLGPKSGEPYSDLPTKTVAVFDNGVQTIQTQATEPEAMVLYTLSNKSLTFVTKETSESDVMYSFEGARQ